MAWVLYVLATGTLLTAAALALDSMLRRTSLPTRWVWVATLAGIVALAAIAPRRDAPASQPRGSVVVSGLPLTERVRHEPTLLDRASMMRDEASAVITGAMIDVERGSEAFIAPLALAWVLASGIMLSLLVIVARRTEHVRIRWPRADVRGVNVRVSPSTGPAVMGVARPDIVVPSWLLARPEDEQHLVVVHEREHVQAHDQVLPLGAWIVVALLPWHPAAWFAMSRLRLAIELDCDARVLRRGVQPRSYGTLLIDIAGQCAGHRMGALALADRPSHLERRLLAMKSTRRIGLARLTTLTGVAALAILMACEARIPTATDVDNMNVASIEKAATTSRLLEIRPDSMNVYVNGVLTSSAEANKIAPKMIATVNITKGKKLDEIWVTTVDAAAKRTMSEVELTNLRATMKSDSSLGLRGAVKVVGVPTTKSNPLVIVDGQESTFETLNAIPRSSIVTVNVVKGASATEEYGARGANGVILVKTKKQ